MYATEQGLLNEQLNVASQQLQAAFESNYNEVLKRKMIVLDYVKPTFGKDGDQFFYRIGDLPNNDCIIGFGDTPMKALEDFCKSFGL